MQISNLQMLREKDMAQILGKSQRTVKRYTQKGLITAVSFQDHIRYPAQLYTLQRKDIKDEYLSSSEACRLLQISRQKIHEMLEDDNRTNTFRHCKAVVNGKTKIKRRQLIGYINQNLINYSN